MIVLISPEHTSDSEVETLHRLFEAGLEHFHFRKPDTSLEDHIEYLHKVDVSFHNRIVTHDYHKGLSEHFNLKGFHLEEARWRALESKLEAYVKGYRNRGFTVSSSYHEPEDLEAQQVFFDYTILSPVFSAISKSGMEGRGFDVRHMDKFVIGMGGINSQTVPAAVQLGFKGVGALGGVWNAIDPVEAFIEIKNAFASSHR